MPGRAWEQNVIVLLLGVLALSRCGLSARTPTIPPPSDLEQVKLHCANYLESNWGTGPTDFGYQQYGESISGPGRPILDESGNVLVADRVNRRILRFAQDADTQVILFPPEWVTCRWAAMSVRGQRLFLLISECRPRTEFVRGLAIWHLGSQTWEVINLDGYDTLAESVVADEIGGAYVADRYSNILYVNPQSQVTPVMSFDQVRELDWSEYSLIPGWDGNLYTYGYDTAYQTPDLLTNWGDQSESFLSSRPLREISDVFPAKTSRAAHLGVYKNLLGADRDGFIYFELFGEYKPAPGRRRPIGHFVRFSIRDDHLIASRLPENAVSSSFLFSLAPDGSLCGITYDPWDASVSPRLLKCEFGTE